MVPKSYFFRLRQPKSAKKISPAAGISPCKSYFYDLKVPKNFRLRRAFPLVNHVFTTSKCQKNSPAAGISPCKSCFYDLKFPTFSRLFHRFCLGRKEFTPENCTKHESVSIATGVKQSHAHTGLKYTPCPKLAPQKFEPQYYGRLGKISFYGQRIEDGLSGSKDGLSGS